MTEDTKRAIGIITPIAEELRIQISADDYFLYCNDQAIGISCNSTYATVKEFIGYVFATVYKHDVFDSHGEKIPPKVLQRVKNYWISDARLQQIKEAMAHERA